MICSARELGPRRRPRRHHRAAGRPDADRSPGAGRRSRCSVWTARRVDIAVTPDRGYCLSIRGVAREYSHADRRRPSPTPRCARGRRACGQRHGYAVRAGRRRRRSGRAGCDRFVARTVSGIDPRRRRRTGWRAPAHRGRHAADLARRRRHQLRDARARPAAARLRPHQLSGPDRGPPGAGRRDPDDPRRHRARAGCRGPAHHRRRAPHRARRRHGRRATPRSPTPRPTSLIEAAHFDPVRSPARPAGTSCRPRRPSASSAGSTRRSPPRRPSSRSTCSSSSAGQRPTPASPTSTRPPLPTVIDARPGAARATGRCRLRRRRRWRRCSATSAATSSESGDCWTVTAAVLASRPDDRTRPRRGGRPDRAATRRSPRCCPTPPGAAASPTANGSAGSSADVLAAKDFSEVWSAPFVSDERLDALGYPVDGQRARGPCRSPTRSPTRRRCMRISILSTLRRRAAAQRRSRCRRTSRCSSRASSSAAARVRQRAAPTAASASTRPRGARRHPSGGPAAAASPRLRPQPATGDRAGWWGAGRPADWTDAVGGRAVRDEALAVTVEVDAGRPRCRSTPAAARRVPAPTGTLVGHAGELHPQVIGRARRYRLGRLRGELDLDVAHRGERPAGRVPCRSHVLRWPAGRGARRRLRRRGGRGRGGAPRGGRRAARVDRPVRRLRRRPGRAGQEVARLPRWSSGPRPHPDGPRRSTPRATPRWPRPPRAVRAAPSADRLRLRIIEGSRRLATHDVWALSA